MVKLCIESNRRGFALELTPTSRVYQPAVTCVAEIDVQAPLDLIWSIHNTVDKWSHWNPHVVRATMCGKHQEKRKKLRVGTEFSWASRFSFSTLVITRIEPHSKIVWAGKTSGLRAIYLWHFTQTDAGVTVRVEQLLDGWLASVLNALTSSIFTATLNRWVSALKAEAERRQQHSGRSGLQFSMGTMGREPS